MIGLQRRIIPGKETACHRQYPGRNPVELQQQNGHYDQSDQSEDDPRRHPEDGTPDCSS
jgi:hypothetical protein